MGKATASTSQFSCRDFKGYLSSRSESHLLFLIISYFSPIYNKRTFLQKVNSNYSGIFLIRSPKRQSGVPGLFLYTVRYSDFKEDNAPTVDSSRLA